jgi:hypothetical protein
MLCRQMLARGQLAQFSIALQDTILASLPLLESLNDSHFLSEEDGYLTGLLRLVTEICPCSRFAIDLSVPCPEIGLGSRDTINE